MYELLICYWFCKGKILTFHLFKVRDVGKHLLNREASLN